MKAATLLKRLENTCCPEDFAKFSKTTTLKNIYRRPLLTKWQIWKTAQSEISIRKNEWEIYFDNSK